MRNRIILPSGRVPSVSLPIALQSPLFFLDWDGLISSGEVWVVNCVVWTRRLFGAAMMAAVASSGFAEAHDQEVVLTVSGLSEEKSFTIRELEEIGTEVVETTTIWTDGVQTFEGVPLHLLLGHLDVTSGELVASAINDYAISLPVEDALEPGPIIAFLRNGEQMAVRDKGPLWIIYPYDSAEEFQTEVVHARSIWQLNRIEIRAE
jgi:hypothetical protein